MVKNNIHKTERILTTFLLQAKMFVDSKVTLVKCGHNHDVYLIENDTEKYIAHVGLGYRDRGSDLVHANRTLLFFATQGIDFVPKIIYFDTRKDILIETYVGEEDVVFYNLLEKQLDTFARLLATIHSFTVKEYQQFCNKNELDVPKIQILTDTVKIFGTERFKTVQKYCPDKKVVGWIRKRLKKNIDFTKSMKTVGKAGLRMGDIGGNIRTTGDEMFFIDWEFSFLGYEHELAYIKIHSHPTETQFTYIVERYAHHSGIDLDALYEEIEIYEQVTRVHDVIWAAMKWGQNINHPENSEKFKELTFQRMKLYK